MHWETRQRTAVALLAHTDPHRLALLLTHTPLPSPPLPSAAPQGCKCLIAIERAKLELGRPDPDSAYWN